MGKLRGEELHQIKHISTAITNLQSGALCETLLRGNFMRNRATEATSIMQKKYKIRR